MTVKKYYIGGMGPYLYDDTDPIDDVDGDFAGETQHGLITDGPIASTHIATEDDEFVRKADISDALGGDVEFDSVTLDFLSLTGLSSDPDNPSTGNAVMWISDGTSSGNAGDLIIKTNVSGVIYTDKLNTPTGDSWAND